MEFSFWSRTWGNRKPVRQCLVQNAAYDGLGLRGGAFGMDGVSHLLHGHGAPHHLCGNLWCKMLFMMWTTSLVLGSVGTLDCCSGDATCGDGWSVPSGEGTWGIQKPVRQSLVQNAAYDVDINFGFGVGGHLGMLLTSWCLWGRMELFLWSRDLGHPKNICVKVWFKTPVIRWTPTLVLGS